MDEIADVGPPGKSSEAADLRIGRIELAREAPVRLGALGIEPGLRRIANDDGREAILEPRVMQVLVALSRAGGRIVSRDELATSCWHGVVVGEDALNRVIGRLRRVLDEVGGGLQLETITKVGYRLVAPGAAATVAVERKPSICVLPFANMSDDPQQAYFSQGICEDIITDLSKVSALRVIARGVAFSFKGEAADAPAVARQLNVSHVLEGSVRKAGGRVRISAQLIEAGGGHHVWAERWDRDLTDIFALQDEISQAIVGALKLRLLPEEKRAIERRGTDNVEAYNLFLMARQFLVSGHQDYARAAEAIVRLCRRATEIDPLYARAWALMALTQTSLHFVAGQPDDGLEAAERALAIDPDLAEAHAVRARHLFRQGHRDEASAEIETALRLDPESYEVNQSAGMLAIRERAFGRAIGYYEKAALAETSFSETGMLISCYKSLGDMDGARRWARITLERVESALAKDQSNGSAFGFGVGALAVLGQAERAREWIDRALLVDPDNANMRYNLACCLCFELEDNDGALELLGPYFDRAVLGDVSFAKIDVELDPLRDDPRFIAMIAAADARLAAAG
ncbi:MAG TPA: tetratricopeptide repeat protein [Caulobacteraceae bacterium]